MEPRVESTAFGSITVGGVHYHHDIIIRLSGKVMKRKKKLSKAVYGTSHNVSLEEAKHVYQEGAEWVIVGSGQYGILKLSDEATRYFRRKGCRTDLLPTGEAMQIWNEAEGAGIGLFHVTC